MPSWSTKRQLLFLLIPLAIIIVGGYFAYSHYFYRAPSCFDAKQDGTETGVDCGGSCSLICTSNTIAPVVLWSKAFNVTGSVWNAVAYVQNPNIRSSAQNVPYEFKLYDAQNNLITTRDGSITIPSNQTFAIFEASISASGKTIARTDFQFTSQPVWMVDTSTEPPMTVSNNPIEDASTSPKISGTVTNPNTQATPPAELVALILDGKGNTIDASKTEVDPLAPSQSAPFIFTWQHPYPLGQAICQTSSAVMLVLDRSGSMQSLGTNPPQPLTDVKNAAVSFLLQLQAGDLAGVVSFATTASHPIDQPLFGDFNLVTSAIQSITVSTSTADQNTNIGDGINQAENQLASADPTLKKVIILLTDGIPTAPTQTGTANYPTLYAEQAASAARAAGTSIYTIGLGQNINTDVLTNIAGNAHNFFPALTTDTLATIYDNIASSICVQKPNTVEILSRFL